MGSNRRGRATRDRIIDAARTAVAKHGLDVTLQQIAEAASTSRQTIYRHFESREQLLTTLVLHESAQMAERLTQLLGDDWRPYTDRLVDAIVYVVTTVRRAPHLDAIVRDSSPATNWPTIDVDNRFLEATTNFLLPYFEAAEAQGVAMRADPRHTLDWVLRVTLMLMTIDPGFGDDEAALRHEVETFVVPSVLRDA